MPTISVIVPVYKVEPYLRRCIDSILAQTYTDFELILVDDGSPDRCGNICDEYAARDSRVRVIHKENGGVSSARNAGLEAARGKYIGFVDADDYIAPDSYGTMLSSMENASADIVYCESTIISPDGSAKIDQIHDLPDKSVLTAENWSPDILFRLAGSVCHCLYSADLLYANRVRFPIGLVFSEDIVFNLYAMGFAPRTLFLKQSFYSVCINAESCTQRFHSDYFETALRAAEEMRQAIALAWNDEEAYQHLFLKHLTWAAANTVDNWRNAREKASLKTRYRKIEEMCNCPELLSAITASDSRGGVYQQIQNKNVLLLLLEDPVFRERRYTVRQIIKTQGIGAFIQRLCQKLRKAHK